jgi:predicted 3-demethylubiquinone-9 3-methyltransferase (glyoxalase superfamily)
MDTITPNLWFDGNAEEAADFDVIRSPADTPSTRKDEVVAVEFTLAGRSFVGINGGPHFSFTEAVSFAIECRDQAEVDRYWDALTADGGSPGRCGWCKDRFGLSWQVMPKRLHDMLVASDRDAAERAMQAMLQMDKIDVAVIERAFHGE